MKFSFSVSTLLLIFGAIIPALATSILCGFQHYFLTRQRFPLTDDRNTCQTLLLCLA